MRGKCIVRRKNKRREMSILDKMGNGEGIEGKCKEEKKMSKVMILKKLKEVKNGSRMVE